MAVRILYVEDNNHSRRIVKKMLKPMGYELLEAVSASQGVTLANQEQPDLILMDIELPDMSGFQAIQQIRQYHHLTHIPIVVVTADSSGRYYRGCLNNGCDAYLNKPLSRGTLLRTVRQVLGQEALAI